MCLFANLQGITVFFIYLSGSPCPTPDFHQILQNISSFTSWNFYCHCIYCCRNTRWNCYFCSVIANWHFHYYSYTKHRQTQIFPPKQYLLSLDMISYSVKGTFPTGSSNFVYARVEMLHIIQKND